SAPRFTTPIRPMPRPVPPSPASRSVAPAPPPTSPAPLCIWRVNTTASSPAPPSTSTAAPGPAETERPGIFQFACRHFQQRATDLADDTAVGNNLTQVFSQHAQRQGFQVEPSQENNGAELAVQ